jgi:plasmid maintenance system antidote protein VapI
MVLGDFRAYYQALRAYQEHLTPEEAARLSTAFDTSHY